MKMKLIPAAILAALSMAGAAQAQVAVYGLLDIGYNHTDNNEDTLRYGGGNYGNSTSRVGVKGAADLGSGIKGSFDLQAGNIAVGTKAGAFFDRQAWFGLAGGFGEVRVGTQDSTAFKTVIGFDLNGAANDTDPGFGSQGVLNTLGQNALGMTKELANYYTPKMGGFQAMVGVTPTGNAKASSGDAKAKGNMSLGLTYAAGALAAGLAYETASTDDTTKQNSNAYSALAASYDLGVAKVSGMVVNGGTNQRGSKLGVAAPVAGGTVGVQYAKNTDSGDTGTEFFWNKDVLKNTTAYVEYNTKSPAAAGAAKTNVYSAGLIYVF